MQDAEDSNIIDFFEAKRQIELEQAQREIRRLVGENPPVFDAEGGLDTP